MATLPARFNLMSSDGARLRRGDEVACNPFADGASIFGIWYARNRLVKHARKREVPKTRAT
jgi:hypothetical protein